jgi:hypothetical protein
MKMRSDGTGFPVRYSGVREMEKLKLQKEIKIISLLAFFAANQ